MRATRTIRPLAALAAGLCLALAAPRAGADVVDGVAAIVGDDVILLSELDAASRVMLERIEQERGPVPPEVVREVRGEALQRLIDEKLVQALAERKEGMASAEEVDAQVERIAADEGTTVEQIYAAAAQHGYTREQYRRQLGAEITRMKVVYRFVHPRVTVTEEEIQELYEERYGGQAPGTLVRARHILVPWPDEPTPEKRDRMRDIAREIRETALDGGDFAELARHYSRAPSGSRGGVTTLRRGEVSEKIEDAVFELPPGEIAEIVETPHGLNLFQVLERYDPAEVDLADVEDQLRAEIFARKTMPEYRNLLEELREQHYIEIVAPDLK